MFINFIPWSGQVDGGDKILFLTGYSDYMSKYFHIKKMKCVDRLCNRCS